MCVCGRRLDTSRTVRRSRFSIYIHLHGWARETTMPCTIINKVSFAEIHFIMKVYHVLLHWPSLRAAITMVMRGATNNTNNTSQFNFIMNLNVIIYILQCVSARGACVRIFFCLDTFGGSHALARVQL